MARGGYQIIDFGKRYVKKSYEDGFIDIFNAIKNTKKVLLVHNLVLAYEDGTTKALRDFLCTPAEIADGFLLVSIELNIIIQVDGTYGIAKWYPYYGDGFGIDLAGSVILSVNDTLDYDDDDKLGVDITELPINDTLEIDVNGKLGVKATPET